MKSLLIFSGGMDSTVLLAQRIFVGDTIETLSFDYGSKHNAKEAEAIKALQAHYEVPNVRITLPFIEAHFDSALLKSGEAIPEGHYADESMRRTVVPFRNGILLSIAVGLAESRGCDFVFYGAHAGDHAIYPDCRRNFFEAFREAAVLGTYNAISVSAPFLDKSKREIALLGRALIVPFEKTWTCYKGLAKHCGKCGACVERREALDGFDLTEYL